MDGGAIEEAKAYALSDDDIRSLLGGSIRITTYPDLHKVNSINELFDNHGRAILFIPQQNEQQGHWTALIRRSREIEFFDPYGEPPEAQKDTIDDYQLNKMKMSEPLLAELLTDCPQRIIYNKVQLQKLQDDVNTCGRHAVCRLLYSKYPLQKYRQIIQRSGLSPDEFVVKLTYDELGK
jgi:hypothetical protein